MQLSVAVGSLGSGPHRALRRSHSSGTSTTRKIYLSPIAASLVGPSTGTPTGTAPSGLVAVIRSDPSRGAAVGDALGRVCDSVYEVSLDTCTLVLNAATEASVVRASLGVISEVPLAVCELVSPFSPSPTFQLFAAGDSNRHAGYAPPVRYHHISAVQVHGKCATSPRF